MRIHCTCCRIQEQIKINGKVCTYISKLFVYVPASQLYTSNRKKLLLILSINYLATHSAITKLTLLCELVENYAILYSKMPHETKVPLQGCGRYTEIVYKEKTLQGIYY